MDVFSVFKVVQHLFYCCFSMKMGNVKANKKKVPSVHCDEYHWAAECSQLAWVENVSLFRQNNSQIAVTLAGGNLCLCSTKCFETGFSIFRHRMMCFFSPKWMCSILVSVVSDDSLCVATLTCFTMTVCLSVPHLQHVSAADSLHEHKVHQLEIYKKEQESKICLSKDEICGWFICKAFMLYIMTVCNGFAETP